MKRLSMILAFAFLICALSGTTAFAYRFFVDLVGNAHKWEDGADTSSSFASQPDTIDPVGPGTSGGATWSIMADGHLAPFGDDLHGVGATSVPLIGMTGLPDVGLVPYEIWAITEALNTWAALSGFTNLGQVVDGDGTGLDGTGGTVDNDIDYPLPPDTWNGNGASNANGGHLGDIRIAAYPMVGSVLSDTYLPGTENDVGQFGNLGGDAHFGSSVTWVDDSSDLSGNGMYDFFTVVLHALGHALGLDDSDDPASVMALYNDRGHAQRILTPDDIAGIQALYGFPGDFDGDDDVDGMDFLAWQRGESPIPMSSSDLADWQANFGTLLPELRADFDGDADVDGADFDTWQAGFGTTGSASHGDGDTDGDGDVDGGDFLAWQQEFGMMTGSGSLTSVVPEPASVMLLFTFSVLAVARCQIRRTTAC